MRLTSMFRTMFAALIVSAGASAISQATHTTRASLAVSPAAQLFERDWVLMNWALKYYDSDHDILIEPEEAETAAAAFRKIADADGDGRISPIEFRQAREFILARY